MDATTCCVVGGGPAGMVLGLLPARAGVDVTVPEKHGDFLRDFRGDTVHASTLTLLDEFGLGARFAALPHRVVQRVGFPVGPGLDLRALHGPHPHIAMVPQWDLLQLLAEAGREEPAFTLRMGVEVTAVVREHGRVANRRTIASAATACTRGSSMHESMAWHSLRNDISAVVLNDERSARSLESGRAAWTPRSAGDRRNRQRSVERLTGSTRLGRLGPGRACDERCELGAGAAVL